MGLAIPQIMYILELWVDKKYKIVWTPGAKTATLVKKKHKVQVYASHVKSALAVKDDYKKGKFPLDYGVDHLADHQIVQAGHGPL